MPALKNKNRSLTKILVYLCISAFFNFSLISPNSSMADTVLSLPAPGTIVKTTRHFRPTTFKGISVDTKNPFKFEVLIAKGDTEMNDTAFREESLKLFKYFLAALTIAEENIWVNLSPHEQNRIIPSNFGDTLMGQDMLAQDYMLKQLTSSILFSEQDLSQEFWDTVYERMHALYGTMDIDVNTFNKVWIVPDEAVVYQDGLKAIVLDAHLKVLLEEDYLAMNNAQENDLTELAARIDLKDEADNPPSPDAMNKEASQILKQIIVPAIEKEVNEGHTFANLRQIYNALILASWYKQQLKNTIITKIYADQNKTIGVDSLDKDIVQKIYSQYVDGFNQGVYNFIREDYDPVNQQIIARKYVSGGVGLFNPAKEKIQNGVKKFGAYLSGLIVVLSASTFATDSQAEMRAFQQFTDSDLYKIEFAITEVGPNFSKEAVKNEMDALGAPLNTALREWITDQQEETATQTHSFLPATQRHWNQWKGSHEETHAYLSQENQLNFLHLTDRTETPGDELLMLTQPLSWEFTKSQKKFFSSTKHINELTNDTTTLYYDYPAWMRTSLLNNLHNYPLGLNPELLASVDGYNRTLLTGEMDKRETYADASTAYLTKLLKQNSFDTSLYSLMPAFPGTNISTNSVMDYLERLNSEDTILNAKFSWKDINDKIIANGYSPGNANEAFDRIVKNLSKERYSSLIGFYQPAAGAQITPLGLLVTAGARFRRSNTNYYTTSLDIGAGDTIALNLGAEYIDWENFSLSLEGNAWLHEGEPGYRIGTRIRSQLLSNVAVVFKGSYNTELNYEDNSSLKGLTFFGGLEIRLGPKPYRTDDRRNNRATPTFVREIIPDSIRNTDDGAMTTEKNVGGIDFNPSLLDLQIKRNKNWVPLPLHEQTLDSMTIEGFIPTIINVVPINTIPEFLGKTY